MCLRSAACFSILCVLRHDTSLYWSTTYGGPFGCSGLLIWRFVSFCRWQLPCYDVLLCADTCWPACWTCASLGQAAVAGRTRVCGCTHSTMTACLADQRAQDVCFSTPMQRWIVNANLTTSSESTSINSQWICRLMFEQFALISPDLSQFRFLWTLWTCSIHTWLPSTFLTTRRYTNRRFTYLLTYLLLKWLQWSVTIESCSTSVYNMHIHGSWSVYNRLLCRCCGSNCAVEFPTDAADVESLSGTGSG